MKRALLSCHGKPYCALKEGRAHDRSYLSTSICVLVRNHPLPGEVRDIHSGAHMVRMTHSLVSALESTESTMVVSYVWRPIQEHEHSSSQKALRRSSQRKRIITRCKPDDL